MKEMFSMWLEKKDREQLESIGKKELRSIAFLINQAIREYLKGKKDERKKTKNIA